MWESPCASCLPSSVPHLLESTFPHGGWEERWSPRKFALSCCWCCLCLCRPSSDACRCIPPPGLVGLLHFYPFPIPFSTAVRALLGFPGPEHCNNLCCSPHPAKSAGARWARKGTRSLKNWRPASWLPSGLLSISELWI